MQILHTMLRVGNLERSVKFYINAFDMRVVKQTEYPEGKFTLVFIGYESEEPLLELTYNWDVENYDVGDGFGHIAIAVRDIYAVCKKARKYGGTVTREPGPMKFGGVHNIAFVQDPDGYKIELIEGTKKATT